MSSYQDALYEREPKTRKERPNSPLDDYKAQVKELLATIEWSGHSNFWVCPFCQRDRMLGHDKGCLLKELKDG